MNRSFRAGAVTGRTVTKEADEELALFLEMRRLEKERNNLLLHSTGELDPPLGSNHGTAPIFKIASSAPARKAGIDDFLNSDSEKNDYDWLLTPPGTPLFPSLDTESKRSVGSTGTPKARPTVLKSRLANAPDPSRSTLAPRQPASSSGLNSAIGTRRPSSSGGPNHSSSRPATPTERPTLPAASKPTRPSTPPSRTTLLSKSLAPPRSSTPVRSCTPTSRPSVPVVSKPSSRSATPTRRSSVPSTVSSSSAPSSRSSSVTKSGPTISKSSVPPHGSSPTIKPRPLKPTDIPGFSLDAPPNLRTSLPERPSSASRGRPGAPSSRSSSVEPGANIRPRRQSCSPSRGRVPNGSVHKGSSVPPSSRPQASGSDNVNPIIIGNKMVERIVNMRRLAPPKQDDQRSSHNNLFGKSSLSPDGAGFGRTLSKKSLDMALRHMDIRRSVPNSLRPLMANIPASSVYSVRSGATRNRTVSVSDSPLATSSTVSSEQSVNNNMLGLDGSEIEDGITSDKRGRCPPAVPNTR
ncbi:Retrotransposon protein [Musa troglodytarum]|uniref:Retrotransposon protein n=1 Tax=Musa troglodytarum TaxID=320322 RepID=A0A9E7HMY5_9LILI|nr:Retrotransposon protein [Musa troglodytarum]URE37496.1 Retrotransposon protein [Musa troglodytarum]